VGSPLALPVRRCGGGGYCPRCGKKLAWRHHHRYSRHGRSSSPRRSVTPRRTSCLSSPRPRSDLLTPRPSWWRRVPRRDGIVGPRPHRPGGERDDSAGTEVHLCHKIRTLILGRPAITDVVPLNGTSAAEVCASAGSAERYSGHPLTETARPAAQGRGLMLGEPEDFKAIPGRGVRAKVNGHMADRAMLRDGCAPRHVAACVCMPGARATASCASRAAWRERQRSRMIF
jgi:hypothetical protein